MFLDLDATYMDVLSLRKFIVLFTYDMCTFLYVSFTSIKS